MSDVEKIPETEQVNVQDDSNVVLSENLITDVEKDNKKTAKKDENAVVLDKKSKMQLNVYDFVSIIMAAFIIITLIFTFAFRLVGVKGQSMENTLYENDWLITMQKSEYKCGDIVVITEPNYFNEPLIKRVIAVGGQTVDIDYSTSTVYVDGKAINEPYIKEKFILQNADDISFPYTVPEGKLFCMGDNRNHSTDSRSTLIGGAVDERYILGKAVVRVLPFGAFDIYDYEQEKQEQ